MNPGARLLPRCLVRRFFLCLVLAGSWPARAPAEETPPAGGTASPPTGAPRSDAYRPLGPELFPFYQHYLHTADDTEVRNVLYLYASSSNPKGSWSRLLAPFFYRSHEVEPEEDHLFLFPLLYFRKSSAEETFNYWIPLYYDRRTPRGSLQFLFPLWLHRVADSVSSHHVLFPLFRQRHDTSDETQPVTGTRLGLWRILELWESRFETGSTDLAALNLFNWTSQEARGGIPLLFNYSWAKEGERSFGHTHLLPFYWHSEQPGGSSRWIVPFYGAWEAPGEQNLFLVPLLSGFGSGIDGTRRLQVLFPLSYYEGGPKSLAFGSFPLFGYSRDEKRRSWNLLYWLYRTTLETDTGKRTHSILYPLGHFEEEPDKSGGTQWLFPYIQTYNQKRLWRLVLPLYYEYQSLAAGETDWFFRLGLPLYVSWGYVADNFSMGFPLYWASRDGRRGWQVLFPLYWHGYSSSARGVHVLPFLSYRNFPSRTQWFVLGPLFVHERFRNLEGEPAGVGNHVLWPLFGLESRPEGGLVRVLPFFSSSRDGETSDLLITPFYYQQTGPRGTHRYVLPFYGRYESPRLERDMYAALLYTRTREQDEAERTVRTDHAFLWWLLDFENEWSTGSSHQHVLPLGFWRSTSLPVDRTVVGPLYYGHRIKDAGEDHHLKLVLGNLYVSKVVDRTPTPAPAQPGASTATPSPVTAAISEPSPAAPSLSQGSGGAPPRETIWSDRGVLWPLSRWYRGEGGEQGAWLFPLFYQASDPLSSDLAIFPFYFSRTQETPYQQSLLRHAFLFDKEDWRGGYRRTVGQILFDWKADEALDNYRLRLLYPLLDYSWGRQGYSLNVTPLFHLGRTENESNHWLFPLLWFGHRDRKTASGEARRISSHFFLLPLYGISQRSTRTDHYALFPLFHLQTSEEAFRLEIWPTFFFRNEPSVLAVRLWPLHADETGATAGDFWVSRYLYLSKRFSGPSSSSYRLEPFLFRWSRGENEAGFGGLLEMLAYDRKGDDSSFRFIPFVFGGADRDSAALGIIPFHYQARHDKREITSRDFWQYLFLTSNVQGASGEHRFNLLFPLLQQSWNPKRPEYQETRFLYQLYWNRRTETSRQFQINPLFTYYRDEVADETFFGFLLWLYGVEVVKGKVSHRLLYFFRF